MYCSPIFVMRPSVFFGDQLQAVFVPADPSMQCHEMFAEIMDHVVRDIRQIQNFASEYVLGKTDVPSEASRDTRTKFSDHSTSTIYKWGVLPNQEAPRAVDRQ